MKRLVVAPAFTLGSLALTLTMAPVSCRPSGETNAVVPSVATASSVPSSAAAAASQANSISPQVGMALPSDAETPTTAEVVADAAMDQAPPCPIAGASRIWCGRSGGVTWDWRGDGLTRHGPHGTPVSIFAPTVEKKRCKDASDSYKVLSIVGTLVSYENAFMGDCGGPHPEEIVTWTAIDGAVGGQPVSLASLFPEDAILRALLADRLVRTALQGRPVPESLDALLTALANWVSQDCAYSFGENILKRFAFHHVGGGLVAVRFGLSHGCEVARGNLTQIGILLAIPPGLAAPLASAASREHGFLMKDADAIARGKSTSFEYP